MPQNLTQLPNEADFTILNWIVIIRDHKVIERGGLTGRIMRIISEPNSTAHALCQLEKYGISYEAAVEYCAHELETRASVLTNVILIHLHG